MRLALWASEDDLAAARVRALAEARGHAVTAVTPGALGADATDLASWVLSAADLDACDAHLVRALPSPFVAPAEGDDAAAVARRAFEAQERVQLAHAALADAEASGARVVNPCASLPFEGKPSQLGAFLRAGLPVPRTLITSLPLAALRFVDALAAEGVQAIAKPLIGGATAKLIDGAARARLSSLGPAPIILQERVPGDDVRVTLVGGAVLSAVVIPSATLDYRDDPAYLAGHASYRTIELPNAASALVLRAAALCAHVVSGVDLKRTDDGRFVLLEANAAPRWLDIEEKTAAPISEAVLSLLLSPPT